MLDIGCGNGAQTTLFSSGFKQVFGLDYVPIRKSESPVSDKRIKFLQGDATKLPFTSESFDFISCFEVLEHIEDDNLVVSEIHRVLKNNGFLYLTVPNRWWIFETHGANIKGFNFIPWNRVPFLSWFPTIIHDYLAKARIYSMRSAVNLILGSGFEILQNGYITAPLDVLPKGRIRNFLRRTIFRNHETRIPFFAVNLFIIARKIT